MGGDAGALVDVELGEGAGSVLPRLQVAVGEHRRLALDYYSYGRDELTHREVDPWRVHAEQGRWYLEGWCHLSDDVRVFRVDRIAEATVLEETFEPPPDPRPVEVFRPGPDDPRVTLDLAPEARWVAEQYPVEEIEELASGGLRVTLAVVARPWLERLLVRLGPEATVVAAPEDLGDVAGTAARRVLSRYGG
nr:WYL domain-containing protein [Rhabdothermincola salaria]